MDKLIQSAFGSIIHYIAGNMESAKEYENLAMKEYVENEEIIKAMFEPNRKNRNKYISKVEDHISKQTKKKLYEMVS